MTAFLIRPGETDFDVQDRVQGALNLPLNEHGRRQVADICAALAEEDLEVVYSSPTEPALSTARQIANRLDLPLKVLTALTNVDLGLWQGLSLAEIRQRQPRIFRQWEDSPDSICPPQGENCAEAIDRIRTALKRPLRRGGPFAIVCSEPLATLVGCVLRQERPHFPGPDYIEIDRPRIEPLPLAATAGAGATDSWSWPRLS